MRKILNWTGSGIFRTIGRTIAYIIIGLLATFLLHKLGFHLPNFLLLNVNASELQSWDTNQARLVLDDHGTSSFTSWQNNPYTFSNLSLPVKNIQFRLKTSDGFSADNTYTFTIQYVPTPDSLAVQSITFFKDGDLTNTETPTCSAWNRTTNGLYSSECSFQPHSNYTSSQYLWVGLTLTTAYQNSVTTGVSNYDERLGVNAVITNQTNIINNSINSLIEQNNANNQALIDAQKSCQYYDKNNISLDNSILNIDGSISTISGWGLSDFVSINNSTEIILVKKITQTFQANACFYNTNKTFISCVKQQDLTQGVSLTIPNGSSYIRFSINKNLNEPQWNVCKNGDQAITDALTDDSSPDTSALNDMAGWLPPGPVDSILNLPLTLFNSLTTALSGTCRSINVTLPYIDSELNLPCITSIYEQIGAMTFVNSVGVIASAFILYKYLLALYKYVDDTLTMRENTWQDWGGVD